jgi:hypothetical protein
MGIGLMLAGLLVLTPTSMTAERFGQAREIFTLMMSVLGTIVGFYYGSTDRLAGQVSLGHISLLDGDPVRGEKHFIAQVTGGMPPYSYTLQIQTTGAQVEPRSGTTPDGWINESFQVSPEGRGSVVIEVTDSKAQKANATLSL